MGCVQVLKVEVVQVFFINLVLIFLKRMIRCMKLLVLRFLWKKYMEFIFLGWRLIGKKGLIIEGFFLIILMLWIFVVVEFFFLYSYFVLDKIDVFDFGVNYFNFIVKKIKKCFWMIIFYVLEQFSNFMFFGIVFFI